MIHELILGCMSSSVVITTRPATILASGGTSCVTNALCKKAASSDGFTCQNGSNQDHSNCEVLGVHYDRWSAETVLFEHLFEEVYKILEAVQPGQEAFEEVQGAIREINLQLQVGQNATSQLLVELDTLKGRQAASGALQVVQFFLFAGYLLTLTILYIVKNCKQHHARQVEEEVELMEQKLQERKAKRRSAAARAKSGPSPTQV